MDRRSFFGIAAAVIFGRAKLPIEAVGGYIVPYPYRLPKSLFPPITGDIKECIWGYNSPKMWSPNV